MISRTIGDNAAQRCVEVDETWSRLMASFKHRVAAYGSSELIEGFSKLRFSEAISETVPQINKKLHRSCGWNVEAVDGLLCDDVFYSMIQRRIFPIARELRPADQIDFSILPDLFHDALGHLPLLTNPIYSAFLEKYSEIALSFLGNDLALRALSRLYWYVIETGLVFENGQIKMLGAAIITSEAECNSVLCGDVNISPFNLRDIFSLGYDSFQIQERYFLLESFQSLYGICESLEKEVKAFLWDSGAQDVVPGSTV